MYLSTLTNTIDSLIIFHIQCLRFIEDYIVIIPILEKYEERINVEQINLQKQIQMENLSFQYKNRRETFHLKLDDLLTFKAGQAILVTEKSRAGKLE
jgi:ABC-type bacteriocin/lantibiotic exporter with double-glycine peptidase domain